MSTAVPVVAVLLGSLLLMFGFTGKPEPFALCVVGGMVLVALGIVFGLKDYGDSPQAGRAKH